MGNVGGNLIYVDKNGNVSNFFPKTYAEQVFVSTNGNSRSALNAVIANLNDRLIAVERSLGITGTGLDISGGGSGTGSGSGIDIGTIVTENGDVQQRLDLIEKALWVGGIDPNDRTTNAALDKAMNTGLDEDEIEYINNGDDNSGGGLVNAIKNKKITTIQSTTSSTGGAEVWIDTK